jgi:hypothetical protein
MKSKVLILILILISIFFFFEIVLLNENIHYIVEPSEELELNKKNEESVEKQIEKTHITNRQAIIILSIGGIYYMFSGVFGIPCMFSFTTLMKGGVVIIIKIILGI